MTRPPGPPNPETQFGRGAWATACLAALILAYGFLTLAYRFTLPTDGWRVEPIGGGQSYLYGENQMGGPSGLLPGDQVIAVAGIPVDDWRRMPSLAPAWHVGATLAYTVIRGGQEMHVGVTLVRWRFASWLLGTLRRPVQLASLLAAYLLLAIAAVVFWRRPGNPAAGAFLLVNAALNSSILGTGTLTSAYPEMIDPLASLLTGAPAQNVVFGILLPATLIRFALVFPHPKPILRRHPWLAYAPIGIGLVTVAIGRDSGLSWVWFVGSLLLMLAILVHNAFTMRDAVSRAQIMWGLGGLIFGFGVLAVVLLLSTLGLIESVPQHYFDLASAIAFTVMGLTLGIAITRYRLFDIDLIIRRTLIYSVLTGLLALAYFGLIVVLEGLLRSVTGQSQNQLVTVVSTLVIAALFVPLRQRVQGFIDRRFYRRRYDAARTLAAFGAAARDEVELDRLSEHLLGVVDETLQPASVELWLRSNPAWTAKPSTGRQAAEAQGEL